MLSSCEPVSWTWEQGRIWANCNNGVRIPTWLADQQMAGIVDLLNGVPAIGLLLLSRWLGEA